MKYLIMLSLLGLFACEKEVSPTTPTVINGLVVDDNDKPVEDARLRFSGEERTGWLTVKSTFQIYAISTEDGSFTFSQVVPHKTDKAFLTILSVFDLIDLNLPHSISLNNEAFQQINSLPLSPSFFGDTLKVKIKVTTK